VQIATGTVAAAKRELDDRKGMGRTDGKAVAEKSPLSGCAMIERRQIDVSAPRRNSSESGHGPRPWPPTRQTWSIYTTSIHFGGSSRPK
jgi:hypothetical protein